MYNTCIFNFRMQLALTYLQTAQYIFEAYGPFKVICSRILIDIYMYYIRSSVITQEKLLLKLHSTWCPLKMSTLYITRISAE